jgi:hypothetical protein
MRVARIAPDVILSVLAKDPESSHAEGLVDRDTSNAGIGERAITASGGLPLTLTLSRKGRGDQSTARAIRQRKCHGPLDPFGRLKLPQDDGEGVMAG